MSSEDALNAEFRIYDGLKLTELIVRMHEIQGKKDRLEAQVKDLNKHFDFLRITKIPAQMEEDGIDRINVTGVGRVSLTADMHVSIKAEKKSDFYQWLRDNGRSDLIAETVNPSTLKATVKNMVKTGEAYPDELLNVSPFTRASITKA